jgi:tetratricopeptide (TPR) repeat protein
MLMLFYSFNVFSQDKTKKTVEKLVEKHKYDKAEKLVNKKIEKDSNDYNLVYLKANLLRIKGDYQLSLNLLEKCIIIDSLDCRFYQEKAIVFLMTNKVDSVENFLNKCVKLNPSCENLDNTLAGYYMHFKNNFYKAEEYYIKSYKKDSNDYQANFNLGILYYNTDKYDLAIKYFTKAIKLNSKNHRAYYQRAWCHYLIDENKKAIADFKVAIRKEKKNQNPWESIDIKEAYKKIIHCYTELNDVKNANKYQLRMPSEVQ